MELVDPPDLDVVTEAEPLVLAAAAEDNGTVDAVSFYVDGTRVGTSMVPVLGSAGRPLYPFTWLVPNSAASAEKLLVIKADAKDLSGKVGQSANVSVEVGMRPARTPAYFFGMSGPGDYRLGALALDAKTRKGIVGGWGLPEGVPVRPQGAHVFTLTAEGVQPGGTVKLPGIPVAATFHGNLALVAVQGLNEQPSELVVIDTTTLSMPVLRGSIDLPGPEVYAVKAEGNLAFVANGEAGVVVVDLKPVGLDAPGLPQRLNVVPVVGDARDVAVVGNDLLVAAGSGGLRVHDLLDPEMGERGFTPVPGGAEEVEVSGTRALVGCQGASSALAVVDLGSSPPLVEALLSHAPRRRDLVATGQRSLAMSGGLAVSTVQLVDQESRPVKGLLSASVIPPEGFPKTFVRANVPQAQDVSIFEGQPFTLFGHQGLVDFNLPQFLVTDVAPANGADQVALSGTAPSVTVTFSQPIDAAFLAAHPTLAVLRVGTPFSSTVVPATASVGESPRQLVFTLTGTEPSLPRNADIYVVITGGESGLRSEAGTLQVTFTSRFRTRAAEGEPPTVVRVEPPAGPEDGGTRVKHPRRGAGVGRPRVLLDRGGHRGGARPVGRVPHGRDAAPGEGAGARHRHQPGRAAGQPAGWLRLPAHAGGELRVTGPGRTQGDDTVELSGAGFQVGATVTFRGVSRSRPATHVEVLSPGRVRLKTPEGDFGPADIIVENPDGQRVEALGAFLYSNLRTADIVSRYDPQKDGSDGRPQERLPQGMPGQLVLSGRRAWVLSDGAVSQGATVVEVLKNSLQGALSLVDVSDPKDAKMMGGVSFPPPYLPRALAVRGTTAYVVADAPELQGVELVGEGGPSLLVVDATNPTAPKFAYAMPFEGKAHGVDVVDDLALVAAGEGGLAIFSLRDPLKPMLVGSVRSFLQGACWGLRPSPA